MTPAIEERLLSMQRAIAEKRTELNRLEGQQDEPLKTLTAEFGVTTLASAKEKLAEEQAELEQLDSQLNQKTQAFIKAYPQLVGEDE